MFRGWPRNLPHFPLNGGFQFWPLTIIYALAVMILKGTIWIEPLQPSYGGDKDPKRLKPVLVPPKDVLLESYHQELEGKGRRALKKSKSKAASSLQDCPDMTVNQAGVLFTLDLFSFKPVDQNIGNSQSTMAPMAEDSNWASRASITDANTRRKGRPKPYDRNRAQ